MNNDHRHLKLTPTEWRIANQRRVALIEKRFAERLSADEQGELDRLQETADRQLNKLDEKMLLNLASMESAARSAIDDRDQ